MVLLEARLQAQRAFHDDLTFCIASTNSSAHSKLARQSQVHADAPPGQRLSSRTMNRQFPGNFPSSQVTNQMSAPADCVYILFDRTVQSFQVPLAHQLLCKLIVAHTDRTCQLWSSGTRCHLLSLKLDLCAPTRQHPHSCYIMSKSP